MKESHKRKTICMFLIAYSEYVVEARIPYKERRKYNGNQTKC